MKKHIIISLSTLITLTACSANINGLLTQDKSKTGVTDKSKTGDEITFKVKIDPTSFSKDAEINVNVYNAQLLEAESTTSNCSVSFDQETKKESSNCQKEAIQPEEFKFKASEIKEELIINTTSLSLNSKYRIQLSGLSSDNCNNSSAAQDGTVNRQIIELSKLNWSTTEKACLPKTSPENVEPLPVNSGSPPPQGIAVGEPNPGIPSSSTNPATEEGIVLLDKTTQSNMIGIDKLVIKDKKEWEELWAKHAGSSKLLPTIDFNTEMVIALFMGQQATAGFEIEVTKITKSDTQMTVHFKENKPAPDALVAQVITSPAHLVKVKKFDGAVVYKLENGTTTTPASTLEKI